jgi:hypothetical protein
LQTPPTSSSNAATFTQDLSAQHVVQMVFVNVAAMHVVAFFALLLAQYMI